MTIYGRSEELVSKCIECDLAEPESLASLGGSAPGLVDGILSAVIEEAHKGNTCVDGSMLIAGCLSGILDPKAPTSHKTVMANEQWKNPVATRWCQITHSR